MTILETKSTGCFQNYFFPTLFGLIFNALITVVDGIFVGQGVGPDGIAAVNIIAPLFMVVTGIGLMLGIGCSVVSGIAMAQGDSDKACVNMTQASVLGAVLIGMLVTVLSVSGEGMTRLLGCSDTLMPEALDYLAWLLPGMFFLVFECIGMMVIRLDGSPKFAMMCNIVPAVINFVFDYILVFPCGMGVKGAAIATSASIAVGTFMVLAYFIRFSYVIKFRWSVAGFYSNIWRQVCIGSSAFITEVAMSVMMLTGNYVFMKYYGEVGVAAFSIACYLFPVMFMMSNAVAQSAQPLISYNYGTGAFGRVKEAFVLSVKVALLCGVMAGGTIGLFADNIVALFIDPSCEAACLARAGLPVYATCAVFFALNISFIGYYQSIEKAMKAMAFTLMRGAVVLVPMFVVMPVLFPGEGVWAAIPASEAITLVLVSADYLFVRRRLYSMA